VKEIAVANALQSRASGVNHGLAPVINVPTDPRFGRTQEAFGEDPFIVGVMATAAVLGLQGTVLVPCTMDSATTP
jgi:beta-glucosidase